MRRPSGSAALAAIAAGATLLSTLAAGELRHADESGFVLESRIDVAAAPGEVYAAFVDEIGRWWNPDHTVSGIAGALYLEARPLGCFCEALGESGAAVHMTVTFVDPGAMLRLSGGLGPLGLMGVAGNMTVEFDGDEDGTVVVLEYAVGGYAPAGLDSVAGDVDRVLGEQLARLARFVTTGRAEPGAP